MSDFLISVTAGKASGKTTVLNVIVDALADAGLMTVADTRYITLHPGKALGNLRITNLENIEQIDITLDGPAIKNHAEAMRSVRAGEYQAVEVDDEPRMVAEVKLDGRQIAHLPDNNQKAMIKVAVMRELDEMLDEQFGAHGSFIPTSINIDMI